MDRYLLYVTIAAVTIASPGPGVILTIANTLRYGFVHAIVGILGVALGMLCVATVSATSLGVIMSTSALAFTALKYIGAIYLIYLGIKLWRSPPSFSADIKQRRKTGLHRFIEGFSITLLNPKPIFFFMSLFPQFIDPNKQYVEQFVLLSLTFCTLVVTIHCIYGVTANLARMKLSSPKIGKLINRSSGSIFMCFGVGLAASNK
ncbi:LysE family translocator [Marinobacter salarius]|uniref:LysE family translocator n=1 Tax=Marinobacter salarius TaxID=1420917 RepID=UPI003D0C136B